MQNSSRTETYIGIQPPSRIFFRTWMGVDYRVWLTLLFTLLPAIGLLAFRLATTQPCPTLDIRVKGTMDHGVKNSYYAGEHLVFSIQIQNESSIEWDFGDGSPTARGNKVSHSYENEGNFLITVKANGRCRESKNIRISHINLSTSPQPAPEKNEAVNAIIGKDFATTGELAIYQTDETAGIYEWTIENNEQYPLKSGPKVSYSFTDAGKYVIKLKLDNDEGKVYRKTVVVTAQSNKGVTPDELPPLPLPPPREHTESSANDDGEPSIASPSPANKKFDVIPDQIFVDNFQAIVDGTGTADEIAKYLCEGVNTKVRGNGKTYANLNLFCAELEGKKGMLGLGGKRKIKSVTAKREIGSNCVYWLDVNYK